MDARHRSIVYLPKENHNHLIYWKLSTDRSSSCPRVSIDSRGSPGIQSINNYLIYQKDKEVIGCLWILKWWVVSQLRVAVKIGTTPSCLRRLTTQRKFSWFAHNLPDWLGTRTFCINPPWLSTYNSPTKWAFFISFWWRPSMIRQRCCGTSGVPLLISTRNPEVPKLSSHRLRVDKSLVRLQGGRLLPSQPSRSQS